MAELVFDCVGAQADRYAVVPAFSLRLRISETTGQQVAAIALRCQLRIEPARRRYSAAEADTEAVLIHRSGDHAEHFVVPVDVCYELAGRLRMLWQGFDGGAEARQSIADFLDLVRSRAVVPAPEPEA